jgi:2-keto-4-pentenoate hydratase
MTMESGTLQVLSRELKIAQDGVEQIEPFTSRFSGFDLADGYEVARLVHEQRLQEGDSLAGRKIGFTNPGMWATYGVKQPIWGYMYDSTVHDLGDRAAWSLAGFSEPKIEPEIVLHFREAPATAEPEALLACIDWIAHGFEIVETPFPGWKFAPPDGVAAGSLHGMLLVGERHAVESLQPHLTRELEDFEVLLMRNGVQVAEGRGRDVLGSPLLALAHLVKLLNEQSQDVRIRAGEMITTGTITLAQEMRAGERWSTQLEGIALSGIAAAFD